MSSSTPKYKRQLKTPITYYGGKQNMLSHIIPIIPAHHTYIEPFFGGGAVFFAKRPSPAEVINDINDSVMNFYFVLKNHYKGLCKEIAATLHSASTQKLANSILYNPKQKNKIKKAWAFWVMCNMSFSANPQKNSSFACDNYGTVTRKVRNAKDHLMENFGTRLEHVQIESRDAIRIIEMRDSKDAFFYVDPPYPSSNCGAYSGYSQEDYKLLLNTLSKIKGKFLLSSYPEDALKEYRYKFNWFTQDHKKRLLVTKRKEFKYKTECLTSNYDWKDTLLFAKQEPVKTKQRINPVKQKIMTDTSHQLAGVQSQELELKLIGRFVNLDRKIKTKRQIKLFIDLLQQSTITKRFKRVPDMLRR